MESISAFSALFIRTVCILFIISYVQCASPTFRFAGDTNAAEDVEFSFNGEHRITGHLGLSLPEVIGTGVDCSLPDDPSTVCRSFGDYANLTITQADESCARVEWTSSYARRLEDCYAIGPNEYLYGGPEALHQYWPFNPRPMNEAAYLSADFLQGFNDFGNVLENYWLISTGAVIHVDETNPLFFSWNTTHLDQVCFVSADEYPYAKRSQLTLKYTVCTAPDIKAAHQSNFFKWYEKPSGLPDTTMMTQPLWSTWAQFRQNITQEKVLDLARKVISEGFINSSHIEIDDKWETCYGQHEFDPVKFPDPQGMINEIKALNLRVTLWVHPFVNFDCAELFATGVDEGYFIKDGKGKTAITGWWAGDKAGAIDVTNAKAATWYAERLQRLKSLYGVDAFKFDAGESNFLPYSAILEGDQELGPNAYATAYAETVAPLGGLVETRIGRMTQKHPIFTRIMDRDSHWRQDAGLKSVIPTILLFGVLGYPFILPDMIGGSGPNSNPWPTKELYLRWVQVNVFMPSMQFSLFPWDEHLDEETKERVKTLLRLREQYKGEILAAAEQSLVDGSPINRPLWWVDPKDPETFLVDQAFMLGDNILVAPVVEEGAISRDIYLPVGTWQSGVTNIRHTGPVWLRDYSVPVETLAFFVKV